jgi:hypothetical protein
VRVPDPALCRALYADAPAIDRRLAGAREMLRDEAVDRELDARARSCAGGRPARRRRVLSDNYISPSQECS